MKDLLEIQPKEEEIALRQRPASSPRPAPRTSMLQRLARIGGGILPYLGWLLPLIDRFATHRTALQPAVPGLRTLSVDLRNDLRSELRTHLAALQVQSHDPTPAIEAQQKRLEKLEEQAAELNHSLTNLSEDQLDLADQVRAMAGWVRNCAIAALFLLALIFILKLIQTIHVMGH
jgi:hypothetical protein